MTIAYTVKSKTRWAVLTLAIALVWGSSLPAWAQNQPTPTNPPRRTPPRATPKPRPAQPNPQGDQPQAQPDQPLTQPGEPIAAPPVLPPPVQEEAQPNEPVGRDETGRVRIDPEVQRKIDEMLRQDEAARSAAENQPGTQPPGTLPNPAGVQNQPVPPPGSPTPDSMKTPAQRAAERRNRARMGSDGPAATPGQPAGNIPQPVDAGAPPEPPGETTVLEIEPELEANPVPAEDREYGFSIKNGTYEQLIKGFAHQTGLGVLGETPREGTVTFETTETLSFRDALSRIRMLLFNYKPHEPYWILHEGTHLRVIRVTDLYRILPKDRMFRSMEEFENANLSDEEIVLVVYTPKTGSISALRQVRDFLPDYVRVTPLEDGNSVSIFALVSDIKKYMDLIPFFPTVGDDPRIIERFDVTNISASQAVDRLRQLADLDNARAMTAPAARGPRGAQPREPSLIDQMSDPLVVLIPDDSQGYILVRGMPNKIDEIRKLLPFVDISVTSEGFSPVVVKVQNAHAGDLVTSIQQVLSASSAPLPGGVAQPTPPSPRRNRRPAGGGGSAAVPVSAASITLLPHPTQNAILVMADDAGVAKVRELVAMFDIKSIIGPLRIQLEVADASEVVSTVTQVLGGGAGAGPKGAAASPESFSLIPDPSGSSIWYSGSEDDLESVKSLIAALDVAGSAPSLHIVRLVYQQPSFVADMLRQFDGASPQSAAPAPATQRPKSRRSTQASQSPSKFTPDDPQKTLYIICSADDFARYQEIIAQLDQPENEKELFIRVDLEHLESTVAVGKLGEIIPNITLVNQDVRTIAVDGSILLVGASPTDVQIIKSVLAEIDKPSILETRTFVIRHVDPADIKAAIEALVPAAGSSEAASSAPSRRRPRSIATPAGDGAPRSTAGADATVSEEMTIFQIGNQLVVKAAPAVLDQVAAVVEQFDVMGIGTDMRVYSDFPPNSDVLGISETLSSVFAAGRNTGTRGIKIAAAPGADGPRFIPQPASNRLVVMAEPSEFGEIEKLLNILRVENPAEASVVEFVQVRHADPTVLVEEIRPLLEMKIRGLVEAGEITEAPAESTTPTTVPRPNRVKRLQQGSAGGSGEKYHIGPDTHNERIVIAAPQRIVDEVKQLIEMFDVPASRKNIIMKNVELVNATPADMVKAVKEMIGKPSGPTARRPAASKPAVAPGAAAAASPLESLGGDGLVVMEAPGGAAVLLRGTQDEVEQAEDWIHQLDAMSTRGRSIKLYEITSTDLDKLFDLIVSVVDVSSGSRAPAGAALKRGGAAGSASTESDDEFSTSRTHASADTYLHADLISDTLLVATTPSKLKQIDDIVNQFTTDEKIGGGITPTNVPKFIYKLEHADATDAQWDLEDLFESIWDGDKPKVEKLFKDSLVIRFPDKSRFDEIRELIREHVDKPSETETKIVRKSFVPPPGLSPEATIKWIRQNHPEWDFEEIDLGAGKVQPTWGVEQLQPPDPVNGNGPNGKNGNDPARKPVSSSAPGRVDAATPCILPLAFQRSIEALVAGAIAQAPPDEEPEEQPAEEPQPEEEPVMEEPMPEPAPLDFGDRLIRDAAAPLMTSPQKDKTDSADPTKDERPKDKKKKGSARLIWDNNQGVYWIEALEEDIDTIKESLDDLDEELDDILVPPDIRIYRVRYIDVFTAQDIIEEMFNATKAMQASVQQQQAQALQAQRLAAQQAERARQQAGNQPPGRGGEGRDGRPGAQPNQPNPQVAQQLQVPQLPAPAVRVYPNPRDRSLILRAETSQYPHILELLATIDQPKPIDSKTRNYPLKRVNAADMEQMLREALHLDEAGTRPRTGASRNQGGPSGPSSSPGGALPETILQESFTGSLLGVDPQDITLFSSETANTIMAVAPPAALDYIGKLIEQFESADIPERLTHFYQLQHADATDVAQQLEAYFEAKSPRASSGRSSRRGGGEGAPSAPATAGGGLNAPSFIAYERLNQLTVHATQEQITEVEEMLTRLDVASDEDAWQDVALAHADAKLVADTLSEMFGGGGSSAPAAPGRPARPGGAGGATGAKFIGESGGRIVFFSAPKTRHQEILATIAKIEEKSQQSSKPRVIELKNATPSLVAEAIEKAYDQRRAGPQGSAPKAPRFTVTAHDPSRRIFVVADDEMFTQIESLITTLDVPGSGINAEFRIYPLKFANARAVHGQMTKLMTEYVQRLGANSKNVMEAFSVQPDETANALIVLGTPSVFGFIEENLRKIDVPAAAQSQPDAHVVELRNADPDSVARALNEIFVRNAVKSPDGDSPITISAVAGSKAIMIRANPVDFARIETAITQLDTEDIATSGEVRVVSIQFGDASEIKTALEAYLQKPAIGGGARSSQLVGDVRLAVMPQTNAIMISGDTATLDRLEGIARGMDIAGEKGSVPQIIPLKFASASLVLPALKEMFSDSKFGGGRKGYTPPVIVADEAANALIIRAAPQELASIQGIVTQLDTEDKVDKSGPRIIQVAVGVNVEDLADQVAESINESAKARMGNARGATVPSIIAIPNLRTNTITLAGSAMLYDEAEAMIKALEKMGPAGGKATIAISPKYIATEDLQRLIDQLTQKQSSGGRRGSSGGSSRSPRGN